MNKKSRFVLQNANEAAFLHITILWLCLLTNEFIYGNNKLLVIL